jgi:UDP-GlcNAc:undecaprenyl-phosphate GlcNAc-1-phosphate transferase
MRKIALLCIALLIATPDLDLNAFSGIAAVLLGAVLINVFNVLDGLDGLAAGIALFTLLPIALVGGPTQSIASVTVGFLVAFLVLNVSPARIFLGNQGSFTLGYVIWFVSTYQVTHAQAQGLSSVAGFALLWLVPLANAAFVIVRRLAEGRPILIGDRLHSYDLLMRRVGLRATVTVFWVASASAATIAGLIRM